MSLKVTFGRPPCFFLLQLILMFGSHHCIFIRFVQTQQFFENYYTAINSSKLNDPVFMNRLTELIYQRLNNVTFDLIHSQIAQRARFCITDPEADWNSSFNFSRNLDFLSKCIITTKGDLPQRICTRAELKFYLSNFIASKSSTTVTFLQPNRNCNRSSWISGCEPGWACNTGSVRPVDFRDTSEIPARTSHCQPCCEGFFCPHGLTCMIPCPLGSYCPLATFNSSTGLCYPYLYDLPAGKPNHTCGGANVWADVHRGGSMFCPAGSYCPTSTHEIPCRDGHYCRRGSTTETRCFSLTSCGSNSATQNITQYGLMLLVGISFLLFVSYMCYGKVMTKRESRYARSRETAAKSVKENASKRQPSKLQSQESFKRINLILPIEQQDDTTCGVKEVQTGFPPIQDMEEHISRSEVVDLTADENVEKVNDEKVKLVRSDTQIFKYAYSQLEMEKAQQQQYYDLTFSEVISRIMDNEIKRRPLIEISFKDLTVTLNQKKCLLRSVTGEIMPGRITAVMGPSGAGKTTLLSALAGRAVGCSMSGTILINGKAESIRSYKKIVGFVPQDDVVHGNLTVEENIWFSADCRLSADLRKADKVLIVERVIESLGLHPVRSSLVGTVENRGISGGQRKRVNVGLELVMEPSLVFLDEPTSGLDSSSSQLLLRALRREAIEGVNICLVVHQPSYSLFNMFDDLILLAKEGDIVFQGPVKDVEGYFANLGINVPERINPPDYFIDVLEEMVKPSTCSDVSYVDLPLRWMLHKGYVVPQDMQNSGLDKPEAIVDAIHNKFFYQKDLSGRKTPCILVQYRHFLGRMAKQRLREARIQSIDYLILSLAGTCLGLMTKGSDGTTNAQGYIDTVIATSLLCKIAALRTFSLDKLQFRRERASGISSLAHFMAKDTLDHFNTLIKPLVYLSTFYFLSNPRSTFLDNYIVLLCLIYCVTGIAYVLAIFLEPGPSQLCSVLLPVVLTLLATQPKDNQFIRIAMNLCYPSWALEAFIISDEKRYYGVWLIQRCAALLKTGYNLHHWKLCISLLVAAGAGCRALALFGMLAFAKK